MSTILYFAAILLCIISLLLSFIVKKTFRKQSRFEVRSQMSGAETAAAILRLQGIFDVRIAEVGGELNDHYDPKGKVIALSSEVFQKSSIAAVAVAAHECGHAVQDRQGYFPAQLRSAIVPAANFGSRFGIILFSVGILLSYFVRSTLVMDIGILLFSFAVLFELVTLPVELNASRRAMNILKKQGFLTGSELSGARKMLFAAAMTYVAASAQSVVQLLRLLAVRDRK